MSHETLDIRAQRDFIHDLSSPLTIALGMVDSLLRGDLDLPQEARQKMEKSKNALLKMSELLKKRREILIQSTVTKE